MTHEMLLDAFSLNNEGIVSLVSLNDKDRKTNATQAFKRALATFAAFGRGGAPFQLSECSETRSFNCDFVYVPELEDDTLYIFNRGIVITPLSFDDQESASFNVGLEALMYCCAAATFNLALVYHKLGRSNSDHNLESACLLYEKCIEMTWMVPTVHIGSDMFMVRLVALNNMVQIRYRLSQVDDCQRVHTLLRGACAELATKQSEVPSFQTDFLPEIYLNSTIAISNSAPCA